MPTIASILLSFLLGWVPVPPPADRRCLTGIADAIKFFKEKLQVSRAMELTSLSSRAPSNRCDSLFQAQRVNARVYFVRLDVGGERHLCRLAVGR
jgi:hypothetical protein